MYLNLINKLLSIFPISLLLQMDQNDIDIQNLEEPFRVTCAMEREKNEFCQITFMSVACNHCDDAPCISACPCGCIYKDEETGFTLFDTTNCIGCHSCAMACPFGAPTYGADGKMKKCDGCYTRVKMGLQPACVHNCPTEAIRLVPREDWKEERTASGMKKIMDKLLEESGCTKKNG